MMGIRALAKAVALAGGKILADAQDEGMMDYVTFYGHILPAYGIDHRIG